MHLSRITKIALLVGTLACGTHSALAQDPFLGEIRMVGFNFAPRGWAFCAGQLLPISENIALFSVLGTTYGGNGISNFALPDLRSRVPICMGNGAGLSTYEIGQKGGAETVTLTVAQLPAHSHPLMGSAIEATAITPSGNTLASKARVPLYTNSSPEPTQTFNGASIGATGGNEPFQILPPYLSVNYIIALEGIFPSSS